MSVVRKGEEFRLRYGNGSGFVSYWALSEPLLTNDTHEPCVWAVQVVQWAHEPERGMELVMLADLIRDEERGIAAAEIRAYRELDYIQSRCDREHAGNRVRVLPIAIGAPITEG